MLARISADLLVILHFAFIVFVVFGGVLVLKWRKLAILHIPCVLWGVFIEFFGWICPLTPLEHYLRETAGGTAYSGGFIDHYIMPLIYPVGQIREMQIWLGIIVLIVNLFVYGLVIYQRSKNEERQ